MSEDIKIEYNNNLDELEKLLSSVERPGDYYVAGRIETPVPKIEIEGAGILSFPIPDSQIEDIIQQAIRAPYGKGEKTIFDTSVRNVWQLSASKVSISGKSWETTFKSILSQVASGLGCGGFPISGELYKLLVYDKGSFFLAHRDTEKVDGMFGTLVVVLPSSHHGGELVIRHAGHEVIVDLSEGEISELRFAAFYADCEHEVKPIMEGFRVALIYNLIQLPEPSGKVSVQGAILRAPLYDAEVVAAEAMIKEAFAAPNAPAKLVWLLEHQYSPDGLTFAGLKNADAARVGFLTRAALRADCAIHLAIVHIEESGSAELEYHGGYGRGRWGDYEEEVDCDDYEVIDVCDSSQYVSNWVDLHDRSVEFGAIPLIDGELLPKGALDGEVPDEQRVTEATGNAGATFERSYHRAAVLIWPRTSFADILLQAGVGALMPYLKERVEQVVTNPTMSDLRHEVIDLARRAIDAWECSYSRDVAKPNRAEMLMLLGKLGDVEAFEKFVTKVVAEAYDGSENIALVINLDQCGPEKAVSVVSSIFSSNMRWVFNSCVELLVQIVQKYKCKMDPLWTEAFHQLAAAFVESLIKASEASLSASASEDWRENRHQRMKSKPEEAIFIADLLDCFADIKATKPRQEFAAAIARYSKVFDPDKNLVSALSLLQQRHGDMISKDSDFLSIWRHTVEFLLARSEFPPEPPKDWRQEVRFHCSCEDCEALTAFAKDPISNEQRFPLRKERRQHLHCQIEGYKLDMTHVTERKGSPHTLVCKKTRWTYENKYERYELDGKSLATLASLFLVPPTECMDLLRRIEACISK